MTRGITAIKIVRKRGKTEIRTESQSLRGSKFTLDSVTLPHLGRETRLHPEDLHNAIVLLLDK